MAMKKGLGKGLDTMIPMSVKEDKVVEAAIEKAEGVSAKTLVKLSKVEPNRKQPRQVFSKESLDELADSIKEHGMFQPILVQDRGDHYEIIAGERRWRAARIAGLTEIPVIIANYSEEEILEISIIENTQREDLNPIEEAKAYQRLMTEFNCTQEEVAKKVSKSRSAVTNVMRLLKLCENVQKMLSSKELSEGHARALLTISNPEIQEKVAKQIVENSLSVRDVEKLVKNLDAPEKKKTETNNEFDVFYKELAENLKNSLGTKVSISGKGDGSGKIEINFYSNDDLDRIITLLK